jgi:nucleotide-binding universal stress UspA family protein
VPSPDEIKRIVVAIDLSVEHAKRCVSFATHLASSPGCETIILTIIKNSDIIDSEGRIDHVKLQKAEGEARNVHEELVIRGNMFDFQSIVKSEFIKSDDVANAICDYCRGVDADVVIVGRRSLGFLEGVLLGSVSGKVVKNAPCSILVVK